MMNQTTMLPARRRSNYFLESQHHPRNLETCTRLELIQRKEKNIQMLSNNYLVNTLPDKGERLRETNRQIDELLQDGRALQGDTITPENTFSDFDSPLTEKIESMSIMTPSERARKRSIQSANEQARVNNYVPASIIRPRRVSAGSPPFSSMFFDRAANDTQKAKVQMISMDESMKLQTTRQHFLNNIPPSHVKTTPPYSPPEEDLANSQSFNRCDSQMQLDSDLESAQYQDADFSDEDLVDGLTEYRGYHDEDDEDEGDEEDWTYGEPSYLDDHRL